MATRNMESLFGRFLFCGVSYGELSIVMESYQASDDWYSSWFRAAERLSHQAIQAEDDRRWQTALHCWLEASALYHFAQFHHFIDDSAKRLAQDRSAAAYQSCIPLFVPPCEEMYFTVANVQYTGYFRAPATTGSFPCVILINGLDSVKEVELHHWSDVFLANGIATFAFNGPGQGQTWREQRMLNTYEEIVAGAVARLSQSLYVDHAHIGAFGISFGGYLACRAATLPQIKAVVDLAGPFDYQFLKDARPALQANFCYAFGVPSLDALFKLVDPSGLQALSAPTCPLLIVHGRQDQSIPYTEAERIWSWTQGDVELQSFADGDHVCTNRFNEVTALIADWLTEQLKPTTLPPEKG